MPEATISCPKCGAVIPLSEALDHRLREQAAADFEKQRFDLNAALEAREKKLASERAALEQRASAVQAEIARQLEAERKKLSADAARAAEEKLGTELKDLQARDADNRAKLKTAQETELALRRRERELSEKQAALALEVERTLAAERAKITEAASARAAEEQRLRFAEKEKIIADMQAQIAALKQKSEQGSMQLQGDVLELDLEQRLATAFPADLVEAVSTGVRGADLRHEVRDGSAQPWGRIIWEAKRTKNWSRDWPVKLKGDQRAAKADLAVLVSQALPEGVRGFGLVEGVWVCDYASALPLAQVLRQWLAGLALARGAETGRLEKTARLYGYLTGPEFRQQIEGVVTAFKTMREDLEAEKRALQKHWARRERELDRAIGCAAALYGSVQGIAGASALPDIGPLALDDGAGS